MTNPSARPSLPPAPPHPAWFLGPAELGAIRDDHALIDRLGRGERPDEDDPDPSARVLARWLREVEDVATTDAAVSS